MTRGAAHSRSSQALPKSQRIAKRGDFLRTYENGRKEHTRFTVVFLLENGLTHPRLGVTATRKLGKAHVRNRFKRWVREIYRVNRDSIGLGSVSLDIVVNIKTNAADADFRSFSEDLLRGFRRSLRPAPVQKG